MLKLLHITIPLILISTSSYAGFLDDIKDNFKADLEKEVKEIKKDMKEEVNNTSKDKQNLDTTEADLWNEIRFQWGKYVSPDSVKVIKHDVTCDGNQDYVATRLNQDNPDGPFYNIAIITKDGGKLFSEHISLTFDGSQSGLCEPIDQPDVTTEIEHWDEGQLDAEFGGWEGMCTEAIRVDDGMCDAFRYFWLTGDREPEDSRFMSHRN